jgi:predicted ArsR family transcriptional regulator
MTDWVNVALPVLAKAYDLAQERRMDLTSRDVAQALDWEQDTVHAAVADLKEAGYLTGEYRIDQAPGTIVLEDISVPEKGLQQVAGWPGAAQDAVASRMLAELDRAIEQAETPEKRSRLVTLREAAGEVGLGTLSGVLARVLTGA